MSGAIDYEQLLNELGSPGRYHSLRPSQRHVLREYSTNWTGRPDVAVELPTGAGKTLIALFIAEAWRREGQTAAILTANKTLARQARQDANDLGIPVVLLEGGRNDILPADRRSFQRGASIGVMNYWVYFNQNPAIDPADFLVMDDAHLAEHCLHSLYSVEIDRYRHSSLFESVVRELAIRLPESRALQDALDVNAPPTTPPELLSFIDQVAFADRLREIIDASPELELHPDLRFRWGRLRDRLVEANIYVSPRLVWIRPGIYPLLSNQHYNECSQRVYMSATIGDPSDLARRLGTSPVEKIPVPPDLAHATNGRRLLVLNSGSEGEFTRMGTALLAALKTNPKSVWLCTSGAEAEKHRTQFVEFLNGNGFAGHLAWTLTSLGDEIDQFKSAKSGHLFVAGRFDGMDFEGKECRLVVVPKLPRAINLEEEFLCAYLRDAKFMLERMNQRIIQALGRCNRDESDYAIYFLVDQKFVTHFGRESHRRGIPPNIMAEIDMAEDDTAIDGSDLSSKVRAFLAGDFTSYDDTLKGLHCKVPASSPADTSSKYANDEIVAWAAMFDSKNYQVAAERFERCWEAARADNLIELAAYYGWCRAKAYYLQSRLQTPGALEKSLTALEEAIQRGGVSAWFNQMRASLNRARVVEAPLTGSTVADDFGEVVLQRFDEILERYGAKSTRFERWCQIIETGLNSDKHDEYSSALEQLGSLIGYHADRPKYSGSADCRWRGVFGNQKEAVTFEVKVEHESSNKISSTDLGQSHNQKARAEAEFAALGYSVRGTIVTHMSEIHADALSSTGGIKCIQKVAILALWKNVQNLLSRYRSQWSVDDFDARRLAASSVRTGFPKNGWLTRALDRPSVWIDEGSLLGEWTRRA
ncbi:MAG TPA: helicase C-terminal domain-containing protein [Verrucomicrobiae bacterium]|nr:helicase C-terminal domain-containing protein [Verrucomicrobiae bacterium]